MNISRKPWIAGIVELFTAVMLVIFLFIIVPVFFYESAWILGLFIPVVYPAIILMIVGSIFCFRKTHWGWALTGAISAAAIIWFIGVISLVFVIISKEEFKKKVV